MHLGTRSEIAAKLVTGRGPRADTLCGAAAVRQR